MRRIVLALGITALLIPVMGALEPAQARVRWNVGADFSVGGIFFSLGFNDYYRHGHGPRYFYRTDHALHYRGYQCGSACYISDGYSYHDRYCPLVSHHFSRFGFDVAHYWGPVGYGYRSYGPWNYGYRYDRRYDRRHRSRYDYRRYDRRHRGRYDRGHRGHDHRYDRRGSDRRGRYEQRGDHRGPDRRGQRYDRGDRNRRDDHRVDRGKDRRDNRGRDRGAGKTRSRRRDN